MVGGDGFDVVCLSHLRWGFVYQRPQHLLSLDLLVDSECGLWHLANDGAVTWYEFARRAAAAARLDTRLVEAVPAQALPARRPRYSVLGSARARLLPPLDNALERYAAAITTR
jgi:dTDP-4-dehydrorhamnose reductase